MTFQSTMSNRLGLAAVTFIGTLTGATLLAATATAKEICAPRVVSPNDGATTSTTPTIQATAESGSNCTGNAKEVKLKIKHAGSGKTVYKHSKVRGKGLTTGRAWTPGMLLLDHTVPSGHLSSGERYRISITYPNPGIFPSFNEHVGCCQTTFETAEKRTKTFGRTFAVAIDSTHLDGGTDYAVEGTKKVEYATGQVSGIDVTRQANDAVDGGTRAHGRVVNGADGMFVRGGIKGLDLSNPSAATIYVDGQVVRRLVIDSANHKGATAYTLESSGLIQQIEGKLGSQRVSVQANDKQVDAHRFEGRVARGADGFLVRGDLENISLDDPQNATLYLDGREAHTVVVDGGDRPGQTTYEITPAQDGNAFHIHENVHGVAVSVQDSTDRIKDWRRVEGKVASGADGYLVTGSKDELDIQLADPGAADVYIDGIDPDYLAERQRRQRERIEDKLDTNGNVTQNIDPQEVPKLPGETIVIDGSVGQGTANYTLRTTGQVQQIDGKLNGRTVTKDTNDTVTGQGQTVHGVVSSGRDGFKVKNGELVSVSLDNYAAADIFLNGSRLAEHTLVVAGGSAPSRLTDYTVQATFGIKQVQGTLNGFNVTTDRDTVKAKSVDGIVKSGNDGYRMLGKLQSLQLKNPGAATVYLDGKRYSP